MPWQSNNNAPGAIRAPAQVNIQRRQDTKAEGKTIPLKIMRVNPDDTLVTQYPNAAVVHPSHTWQGANTDDDENTNTSPLYIYPRSYAQFILLVRRDDRVPVDTIVLTDVQLINLEVCHGETEDWTRYDIPSELPTAQQIRLEIRPVKELSSRKSFDVKSLAQAWLKHCWQRVVTENERLSMSVQNTLLFARIVSIEGQDEGETEFTMPDVFRAIVDESTDVKIQLDGKPPNFVLEGFTEDSNAATGRSDKVNPNVVLVTTSDDEEFPVKKKLLHPCIKLTSAVLAGKGVHKDALSRISVKVDCLTFDRVLLYLEFEARQQLSTGRRFEIDPVHAEALLSAAKTVGCIGLEEVCKARLGEFESRVRKYAIPFSEVLEHNAKGDVWLVMDGMVFDVTRWLPEHPGGSTIIPEQAVNVDCTVMFEIYHSSRQSFRYLKQFYIGEIDDIEKVPKSNSPPSEAFVEELRGYTQWRVTPKDKVYKSF